MRMGMKVIIEDYVNGEGMKIVMVMMKKLFKVVVGIEWVLEIIKIRFGGWWKDG